MYHLLSIITMISLRFTRVIIQVLISGRGRTEVVTVCSNSPGKALYQVIGERSGIQVPLQTLIHGVNIIRHNLSLKDQGIHHLSTVFVLPVMWRGGATTRLGILMYTL